MRSRSNARSDPEARVASPARRRPGSAGPLRRWRARRRARRPPSRAPPAPRPVGDHRPPVLPGPEPFEHLAHRLVGMHPGQAPHRLDERGDRHHRALGRRHPQHRVGQHQRRHVPVLVVDRHERAPGLAASVCSRSRHVALGDSGLRQGPSQTRHRTGHQLRASCRAAPLRARCEQQEQRQQQDPDAGPERPPAHRASEPAISTPARI
jgi:hypothetical protein